MRKITSVAIVGPKGYITSELIAGAFRRKVLSVVLFEWDFPDWKFGASFPQLLTGGRWRRSQIKKHFNNALSRALSSGIDGTRTLLLAIMPAELSDENQRELTNWSGPIAQWAIDSLKIGRASCRERV